MQYSINYLLFWHDEHFVSFVSVMLQPPGSATEGRHTQPAGDGEEGDTVTLLLASGGQLANYMREERCQQCQRPRAGVMDTAHICTGLRHICRRILAPRAACLWAPICENVPQPEKCVLGEKRVPPKILVELVSLVFTRAIIWSV